MAYMTLETSVRTHPKFLKAGPEASWLWVCGLGYCQDGLTDGFIPDSAIEFLGVRRARTLAHRLVSARLWEVVTGGWQLHDYLAHNKPGDVVREMMRLRREGGRLGGRPKKNLEGSENGNLEGSENGNLIVKPPDQSKANLPENPVLYGTVRDCTSGTEEESLEAKPPSKPAAISPSLLTYPTIGANGDRWVLTEAKVAEWRALFPGLDVLAEARKALAWVQAHPDRRKTVRGMPKFLVAWLTRAVDVGHGRNGNSGATSGRPGKPSHTPADVDKYAHTAPKGLDRVE